MFTTTWPVSGFLSGQRTNAELFTVGALIGLVLAAAGVYSVTNLEAHQRQLEIDIRRLSSRSFMLRDHGMKWSISMSRRRPEPQ